MKVFAMTLRRAPERGLFIQDHLARLGVDHEIVDCIDFKDYGDQEYRKLYDEEMIAKNPYFTMGVVGCTLSHLKIYEMMIAQDLPYALIMEDDAILPDNITSIMDLLEPELGEEDVIAVSYHNHGKKDTYLSNRDRKDIGPGLELVYPVHLHEIASTMAYVITRKSAAKMLQVNRPVRFSSDYWGDFYDQGVFRSFRCVYPMLVMPAVFRTTIDYPATKTLISKLARWIRAHRVPFLFNYLDRRSTQKVEEKYQFLFSDEIPYHRLHPAGNANPS